MRKSFKIIMLLGLLLLTLSACSRSLGYGVVLWSSDEVSTPTGSIVSVRSKIESKKLYRINSSNSVLEIEQWRIALFKNHKLARIYADNYEPYWRTYVNLYQRRSLPMRSEPSSNATFIYNIGEGQTLKVLDRSEDRVTIGAYRGYWYKLLSNDGVQGWAFGRYLQEYLLSDSGRIVYTTKDYMGDALLENFFEPSKIWRPNFFQRMINEEQINLDLFKDAYGLFIDPDRRSITIALPDRKVVFYYNTIMAAGHNTYFFDGTSFSFTVEKNLITARYEYDDQKFSDVFVPITADLSTIIAEEHQRRTDKYREFISLGPTFKSSWGMLSFGEHNNFSLVDGSRFVRNFFLTESSGSGTLAFDIGLSEGVREKYDGAFSLLFENGERLIFIYTLTDDGFDAKIFDRLPENKLFRDIYQRSIDNAPLISFKN